MDNNSTPKRRGLSMPVIVFFVFAIAIVGAFLIVGLCKSCSSDEEQRHEDNIIEQNYAQSQSPSVNYILGQ